MRRLAAVLLLVGCHAEPPGVRFSGSVSLGAGMSATGATTLELRACPAGGASTRCDALGVDPVLSASLPAGSTTFPFTFALGNIASGPRVAQRAKWQVIAWLQRGTVTAAGPASSEVFGTATAELTDCSGMCSGPCFCGLSIADVVIDQTAP